MQPTLRQFEVFLAVAKAGSFRGAAVAMHLSQPALSQVVGAGGAQSYVSKHGYPVTVDVQADAVTAVEFDAVIVRASTRRT